MRRLRSLGPDLTRTKNQNKLDRNQKASPENSTKPDARQNPALSGSAFENLLYQRKKRRRTEIEENQQEPGKPDLNSGRQKPETSQNLPSRIVIKAARNLNVKKPARKVPDRWKNTDIRTAFAKACQFLPNIDEDSYSTRKKPPNTDDQN